MAHFHFRFKNESQSEDFSAELNGEEMAWREATTTFAEIIKDIDGGLDPAARLSMEVYDESKTKLFVLHYYTEKCL